MTRRDRPSERCEDCGAPVRDAGFPAHRSPDPELRVGTDHGEATVWRRGLDEDLPEPLWSDDDGRAGYVVRCRDCSGSGSGRWGFCDTCCGTGRYFMAAPWVPRNLDEVES